MPINYTAVLSIDDVGNVPSPSRKRNPAGTVGAMNWGMIQYTGANTADGTPSAVDVTSLVTSFSDANRSVGTWTVEHWFGIDRSTLTGSGTDPFLTDPYRNCVPLYQFIDGQRRTRGPAVIGNRTAMMTRGTRKRIYLAACLVGGGMERDPLFSKCSGKDNKQYTWTRLVKSLGEAVDTVFGVTTGENGVILQAGWILMTITPSEQAWLVTVEHCVPVNDEYDEMYDNMLAETGGQQ